MPSSPKLPVTPGSHGSITSVELGFTPVPVRARHDGWTVERQIAFIEALAESGIVEDACRRVGMSRTAADNLRHRPCGMHFRRAWEAAVDYAAHRIEEEAHMRSRRGVARPIFFNGEQVGEWRQFDERLTMFLLRAYRPARYTRLRELPPPPIFDALGAIEEPLEEDPAITLDGELDGIEFGARDVPPEECGGDDDEPGLMWQLPSNDEQ
jgi:hypothetical protein